MPRQYISNLISDKKQLRYHLRRSIITSLPQWENVAYIHLVIDTSAWLHPHYEMLFL